MNATLATRFSSRARMGQVHASAGLALSESDLMRAAPSIFAESAHESRSARYTHIPTVEVLRGLAREGFQPFFAVQGRCRVEGKEAYTKHMLRFRHVDSRGTDSVNEIILINSHDGTSSYQMLAGCFRFVCANGLICGNVIEDIRIKHTGRVVEEVVEGAHRILGGFEQVDAHRDAFQALQLTSGEQAVFANAALAIRYPDKEPEAMPVRVDQVLQARRYDDQGADLWSTFNRVQENLVNGGLRGRRIPGQARRTTRAVNGIDGNVALNRGLWVLAEQMRALKVAA